MFSSWPSSCACVHEDSLPVAVECSLVVASLLRDTIGERSLKGRSRVRAALVKTRDVLTAQRSAATHNVCVNGPLC